MATFSTSSALGSTSAWPVYTHWPFSSVMSWLSTRSNCLGRGSFMLTRVFRALVWRNPRNDMFKTLHGLRGILPYFFFHSRTASHRKNRQPIAARPAACLSVLTSRHHRANHSNTHSPQQQQVQLITQAALSEYAVGAGFFKPFCRSRIVTPSQLAFEVAEPKIRVKSAVCF
jgi:hypothetical protein